MDQPSLLVLSHHHELLPFANRLQNEGLDVRVGVWSSRYTRAWEGSRLQRVRIEPGSPIVDECNKGERWVLTNSHQGRLAFGPDAQVWPALQVDNPPQDRLRFGAWLGPGGLAHPHLLVVDQGVWPGGLGPNRPGALTLVWWDGTLPDFMAGAFANIGQGLAEGGFQGLFQFDLVEEGDGFKLGGLAAGWPSLHLHAFAAELSLRGVLLGEDVHPAKRFVVAVPVTVPPWPHPGRSATQPVGGLTQSQRGAFWWHDVRFAEGGLETAGLDGLVGVAIGSADSYELARAEALELAFRAELAEKQYRPDAGALVGGVLATLEKRFDAHL